jgi:DNA-binding CsgD family transcriptional regulator
LQIALPTAKKHVGSICRKLSAANRSAAVAIAYETGLLSKGAFYAR